MVTDVGDRSKICADIQIEMKVNNDQIARLLKEEETKRAQNIIAGSVGAILFWPALFAMDFKDAAGAERQALQARQEVLNTHQAVRCTDTLVTPIKAQ